MALLKCTDSRSPSYFTQVNDFCLQTQTRQQACPPYKKIWLVLLSYSRQKTYLSGTQRSGAELKWAFEGCSDFLESCPYWDVSRLTVAASGSYCSNWMHRHESRIKFPIMSNYTFKGRLTPKSKMSICNLHNSVLLKSIHRSCCDQLHVGTFFFLYHSAEGGVHLLIDQKLAT